MFLNFKNMELRTIMDIQVKGKKILLRSEFNIPMKDGEITDDTRIKEALPTIEYLLKKGAKLIVCAHLGRPKGEVKEELRLTAVAKRLEEYLNQKVIKMDSVIGNEVFQKSKELKEGEIMLLENIRFEEGEEKNDPEFSKKLSTLAEIFVSDAFGAVHRAHSSTVGVAKYLPAYAGFLVEKEVKALSSVLNNPKRPLVMIVAGAKIETKVAVIDRFLDIADKVIIGGGIANTLLSAQGKNVGCSLCEKEEIDRAKSILNKDKNNKILLPKDVVVAEEVTETAETRIINVNNLKEKDKILDIGNETISEFVEIIKNAGTVVWNGPVGVYEVSPFAKGTKEIAKAMAETDADTIIGGGDSVDAVMSFGYKKEDFTHISTGGGASLEFFEGKELPGIKVLMK